MASRKRRADTLGEAKKYAQEYANEDGAPACIFITYSNDYAILCFGEDEPGYFRKLVYKAQPGVMVITLTPEEYKHYQEYIETERMVGVGADAHFEGGMYKTETEKGILAKLKAAFSN